MLLTVLLLLLTAACSLSGVPGSKEECKIRTYIEVGLRDYLTKRNNSGEAPRFAVIPFDVPATFALTGPESNNFGRQLAAMFNQELLRQGELGVVELFDTAHWPGKRADFFSGNYQAIELARKAGYDFVVLGYMEDIVNESDISLFTRIIDTSNGLTVWYARSTVSSNERLLRRTYSNATMGFILSDQPELFHFPERENLLVNCTVTEMLSYNSPSLSGGNEK